MHPRLFELTDSQALVRDTARNYAMFANEGGAYDDLLAYLRAQKLL